MKELKIIFYFYLWKFVIFLLLIFKIFKYGGKKKKINGVCIVVRNYLLKVNNLLFYVYIVKV